MTDLELRDETVTLRAAGHETTAVALSWTWYLLAQQREVEAKLQQELRHVLMGWSPLTNDLQRLPYTEMVIKESIRLYPPAWGIGRRALKEFEIGGYGLLARSNVFLMQWLTHRDPRFYNEPEGFRPERWEEDPIRNGKIPLFAYFPIGGGPRSCIGASFAMIETALLVATIAQRVRLTLAPGHRIESLPSLTLRSKHGIRMALHKRPVPPGSRRLRTFLTSARAFW